MNENFICQICVLCIVGTCNEDTSVLLVAMVEFSAVFAHVFQ